MNFFSSLFNSRKASSDVAADTTAETAAATTPDDAPASSAGAEEAGAEKVGAEKDGAEKDGAEKAFAEKVVVERAPDVPPQFLLRSCGPAQWTTINCHACGNHLGQGFNSNCRCGRCPCPPMVPVMDCPCRGRGICGPAVDICAAARPARAPQPAVDVQRGVEVPRADGARMRIGATGQLAPALDSAVLYREGGFSALAARFEENGYLAFSNFVPPQILQAAAKRVLSIASVEEPPRDWEANLGVGTNWSADLDRFWRDVGSCAELVAMREAEDILHLISGMSATLGYPTVPACLPQFTFARGKGPGAGTAPHVDFHGSSTADAGLDRLQPGFVVWTMLSGGDVRGSSELCISPGSHNHEIEGPGDRVELDGSVKKDVLPLSLREMLDNDTMPWHILNEESGLNRNGTLVLLHPRVAHAATVSTVPTARAKGDAAVLTEDRGAVNMAKYRVSWDARFASSAAIDT